MYVPRYFIYATCDISPFRAPATYSFAKPCRVRTFLSFISIAIRMPRGWYLAQGLIPLGYSSSDDEEGPCELPDGRLVCGPHGLVSCGKCCSDYSFMDDVVGEDEYEDEDEEEDNEDDQDDQNDENEYGNLVSDEWIRQRYGHLDPEIRAEIRSRLNGPRVRTGNSSNQGPAPTIATPQFPLHLQRFSETELSALRRGTGRVFPTRFTPPSPTIKPTELFPGKATYVLITRYIHRDDPYKILIFTDGACLNNGQSNPKAGWAFVHGPGCGGELAVTSSRLENVGPFGDPSIQSSNRAELRAVIAALRFRSWDCEGYKTVVIATDSAYVTQGSTVWAKTWVRNGWQKNDNGEVKNKDLWEALLGEVERWQNREVAIQFWQIPRDWNNVADAAAKQAAERDVAGSKWGDVLGICC
ncbi:ribonuclease H-like protein [Xylaria sp. FL1777]|nr:ribonuclease H-like protein [Xylaria sp. FL1777]